MCIFCKIVNGDIPSYKIYEDNDVLAFLDISQITIGHTLIIPKKHYENLFLLNDDIASKILTVASQVARKLQTQLQINDLNLINNNGIKAGQEINHFHLHLLPRYDGDHVQFHYPAHEIDHQKLQTIHKKILGN